MLNIGEVGPPKSIGKSGGKLVAKRDMTSVSAENWAIAEVRRRQISPLLDSYYRRSDTLGDQVAAEAGVSRQRSIAESWQFKTTICCGRYPT